MIIPSKPVSLAQNTHASSRVKPVAAFYKAVRAGKFVARLFHPVAHKEAMKFVTNTGRVLFSRVHPSDMIHRTGGRRG